MNGNSSNLIRAIRGPIILITVGVLFALDHMTQFTFGRTWPAILIVLGLLGLGERFASPAAGPPRARPRPILVANTPEKIDEAPFARRAVRADSDRRDLPVQQHQSESEPVLALRRILAVPADRARRLATGGGAVLRRPSKPLPGGGGGGRFCW